MAVFALKNSLGRVSLSEEAVKAYINGSQNFRKGQSLVACGDVRGVTLLQCSESNVVYQGIVHAEKRANWNYVVTVTLKLEGVSGSTCTCIASSHKHNHCKHIAALLSCLLILKSCSDSPPRYIELRKKKMSRFGPPGTPIYEELKCGLSYSDILEGFVLPPLPHRGTPAKIQFEVQPLKRKGGVKKLIKDKREKKKRNSEERKSESQKRKKEEEGESQKVETKEREKKERKTHQKRKRIEFEQDFGPPKKKREQIETPWRNRNLTIDPNAHAQ